MNNKRNLSLALLFAMILNLFAFPGAAALEIGGTSGQNPTYTQANYKSSYTTESDTSPYVTEDDTDPYIMEPDTNEPESKAKTVLDIGRGDITISSGSVTGLTPDGAEATVNPEGYEIVGTTTTNKITVSDAVPIAINGVTMNYAAEMGGMAINMVDGGEIIVLGTNTINRVDQDIPSLRIEFPLLGHENGKLTIKGTGTLNMTDGEEMGPTIGTQYQNTPNINISGAVTINATKAKGYGAVIGGASLWNNAGVGIKIPTVVITEDAKVNAKVTGILYGSIIGAGYNAASANVTISGRAHVTAGGGVIGDGQGAAIGLSGRSYSTETPVKANINIEDGAYVKIIGGAGGLPINTTGGMGIPNVQEEINSAIKAISNVRIAPTANVEAPVRENYYKALDGTTPVYRVTATQLAPNTDVTVVYSNKTSKVRTNSEGKLYLYLPTGTQTVIIDGASHQATVSANGTAVFALITDSKKTVLDIGQGDITITRNSVTGFLPSGNAATVNPDGYEITGATTTNTATVSDDVPIAINNVNITVSSFPGNAINMINGGEITVLGTNTIGRVGNNVGSFAGMIGQDSGILSIKGSGTLNMTDTLRDGTVIGGNYAKSANVNISGDVTINAVKTNPGSVYSTVIGVGSSGLTAGGAVRDATITITDNARVNASINGVSSAPVIGVPTSYNGAANITISGRAQLIANGGSQGSTWAAPVIGVSNTVGRANITIEEGTLVKITTKASGVSLNSAGMGMPRGSTITNHVKNKSNIKISPFANVFASEAENYYKAPNGTTPVYRVVEHELAPNKEMDILYDSVSSKVQTDSVGSLYLYLPLGTRQVVLDGKNYEANVNASGTAGFKDGIKRKIDIGLANVIITSISVSAKTSGGKVASFDADGYEITGTTTTNIATVSDAVPIAINNVNIAARVTAINMVNGGEITVLGTNIINRRSIAGKVDALIGQDSGILSIKGNGILNVTDNSGSGTTIGGNYAKSANVNISGDVTINAVKTTHGDVYESVIGGGNTASITGAVVDATITITDNARVNASINGTSYAPVIGVPRSSNGTANITISGRAQLVANGGSQGVNALNQTYAAPVIGVNNTVAKANITIGEGALVEITTKASGVSINAAGMGMPRGATISNNVRTRSNIKISPFANVFVSEAENYYKAPNGTTPVYRTTANGLVANTDYDITHAGKTIRVQTNSIGKLYLYLPRGTQSIDMNGAPYQAVVNTSGTAVLESVENSKKAKLDIGQAPITITGTTVTGKTPNGLAAVFDSDGYEIIGTTTTNTISVSDMVPIALNGVDINYDANNIGTAINLINGGEITVFGTNTINRNINQTSNDALIGQNSGTIHIKGDGKLNIIDKEDDGATIGGNGSSSANIIIEERVDINIASATNGAVIGTGNNSSTATANITIGEGVRLRAVNQSAATSTNASGVGLPGNAAITSAIKRTTVKVSSRANIDAPARENYYKDLTGTNPVYKAVAQGLVANTNTMVNYDGVPVELEIFNNGTMSFYLPVGDRSVNIDGEKFEGLVADSVNNKLFIKTVLTAEDISVHASEGIVGVTLTGHQTSSQNNSPIQYKIIDAANTGAEFNGGVLTWKAPGTIRMNATQEESGKYSSASVDFLVNFVVNPGDVYVQISSVGPGKVIAFDKYDKQIVPVVPAGDLMKLRAIPNRGYDLEKWVKTTEDGKRAIIKTEELPPTHNLRIIAKENENYTGYFKVQDVLPGPKIDVLQVSSMVIQPNGTYKEKYKPLILQDGSADVTFNPNKLEYGLYLRSVDTDKINVYVRHSDTKELEIKIGDSKETLVNPFDKYKIALTLKNVAYQEIPILVSDGVDTQTYLIKVFKPTRPELDPHIYTKLREDTSSPSLGLDVYVTNTDVSAFSLTVRLDELLLEEDRAFEGFTDNDGVLFNNSSINLGDDLKNYFDFNPRFKIVDMRSDGKFVHFTAMPRSGAGDVEIVDSPERILTLNLKRNPLYTGVTVDEVNSLIIDNITRGEITYGNSLSSKFYGDINDTFNPAQLMQDVNTLSYIDGRLPPEAIRMFLDHDANAGPGNNRIFYEVLNKSDRRVIVPATEITSQNMEINIYPGEYIIRVIPGGYSILEFDVIYDGEIPLVDGIPSVDGIVFRQVRLLAGELTDDGIIGAADRAKLISALNHIIIKPGSGFATIGNEKVFADYNNDNRINSLDLGRLMRNVGKTYGKIEPINKGGT